jgi:hypothetical protein
MKTVTITLNGRETDDWLYQYYEKERLAAIGVLQ